MIVERYKTLTSHELDDLGKKVNKYLDAVAAAADAKVITASAPQFISLSERQQFWIQMILVDV